MQTAKPSFTLIFASSSFFFFLLLCRLPAGVSADNSPKMKMNENEKENAAQLLMGKYVVPTHSSFLKSEIGRRRRRSYVWCGRNSSICEREGKGSRCCWKSFCKNISDDNNHCGECGNACGSGLSCCNGRCVDLNNNRHHCGGCHRHCPSHQTCYFGMCDYSGDDGFSDSACNKCCGLKACKQNIYYRIHCNSYNFPFANT